MKKHFLVIQLMVIGLATLSLASSADWKNKMHRMSAALQQISPYLVSSEDYANPKSREGIKKNLADLASLAHQLGSTQMPETDPSLLLISSLLEQEAEMSRKLYFEGFHDASRTKARTLVSYCIGCHTRHGQGIEFKAPIERLSSKGPQLLWEQADLMIAMRNFDQALANYQQLARNLEWAKRNPLFWEKAIKKALIVAIRVKEDPEIALNFVQMARQNPEISYYFEWDTEKWVDSLNEWKAEKKTNKDKTKALALITQAKALIERGKRIWDSARDEAALVDFLRASNLLHQLLKVHQDSQYQAETLYLLGFSYDALSDLDQYSLHEWYYTLCIKQAPHSTISQGCYRALEESTAGTYLRAAQNRVPLDIEKRLKELKALALPRSKK